ncbi:MAG: Phosphotransferase enzyme family [Phormidesmis priestleyi Ana]|uniref:Phosphotransferase enzyme family n=1 Tax=Phormidesmis priestleyi Ana TaxID=1666911 RepID=A0A0P7ZGX3_9CYAN|nr:MAG: Phosphotransferase enzyme family [Phormidesmis priestleyi Ana]
MPTVSLNLERLKAQLAQALDGDPIQRFVADEAPLTLQLLAHGEANVIFRLGTDRLVRVAVNTPNQRFEGDFSRLTAFEATVLQYLQGTGISQSLLAARTTPSERFPYTYLITNYLAGQPLDYSRPHLQRCAHTLARLHRLPLDKSHQHLDRLSPPMQRIERPLTSFFAESQQYAQPYLTSAKADPEIVEMLHAVLAKAEARLPAEQKLLENAHVCLVHSDHTYENWVIDDQQAFLIDWEWAELGSPAGDLGHFLSPVTVRRYRDYAMPAADRQFFLETYYEALENAELAAKMRIHLAAFGAFPAVRSLCWTAGYWITANRWYDQETGPSAAERRDRLQKSQQQFRQLWAEVMSLLEEPLP